MKLIYFLDFQEILKQYKVKCEDFILARQTEKEDLIRDIQQGEQQSQYHAPQQQAPMNVYPNQMPNLANMKPVYQQAPPPQYPMGGQPSYGSAPPGYGMPQQYPPGYGAPYQQFPPQYQQQQQQQRPPNQPYFPGQYQYPPKQ